jgi:crotonobetainyl-CoA:carnitine CoA-transferase CaiB-like acyl-CoA transferase
LLISGCVVPPRQLGTSDAVVNVSDSVQTEPLQEASAKQTECPVVQQKTNWWAIAGWSVALFATSCAIFLGYRGYKTQRKYESIMQPTNTGHLNNQQARQRVDQLESELKRYQNREHQLLQKIAQPEQLSNDEWAKRLSMRDIENTELKTINEMLNEALAQAQSQIAKLEIELNRLRAV